MYKVLITDPWTGRIYNPNGTPYRESNDEPFVEKSFASLERAKKYCRGVVRRYPNLCCTVTDEDGNESWKEMDSGWLEQRREVRLQWNNIYKKELHRHRLIFLGFLLGFSLLVATCSAFAVGVGLSLWMVLVISCCLAVLVWLAITLLF
jgi:hypothetical protein